MVVVEVAGSRHGFAKLLREGEVLQGEREAPGAVVLLPSLPPLYIGPLEGGEPALEPIYMGGRRPREWLAPQGKWRRPPPLGFPTLGAGRRPMGGAPAH